MRPSFHAPAVSMYARSATLGGSLAVHATLLLTALGRPLASQNQSRAAQPIIELDEAPRAVAPLASVVAPQASRNLRSTATTAGHTHAHPVPVASHDWKPHDSKLVPVTASRMAPPIPPAQAAPPLDAPDQAAHFTIAVGAAPAVALDAEPTLRERGHDSSSATIAGISSPARLASGGAPPYPYKARAAGIEGEVPLEIIVSAEGAVESAQVIQRAGFGLDEAAVVAVRGYRFSPAISNGRPVRVRMRWVIQFRLR